MKLSRADRESVHTFNRRKFLAFTGASMLAGATRAQSEPANSAGARLPACILTPAQTEGPYFVDERLNRSDIRSDPSAGRLTAGVPLTLGLHVSAVTAGECKPLAGAMVDIWHCDATGAYSDVNDGDGNTAGKKFLRGYQVTDRDGNVRFTTIYPGWYPGRAVHVHFKVRVPSASGRDAEFTSQLYFDDAVTDRVYAGEPYARRARNRTRNEQDGIFRHGGKQLLLRPVEQGEGYAASFDIGIRRA